MIAVVYAFYFKSYDDRILEEPEIATDINKQFFKLIIEINIYYSIFLYGEAILRLRKLEPKYLFFNIIWASISFLLIIVIYQNILTKTL